MSQWLQIDVERVLAVHRGRDVILCDRDNILGPLGGTLLVLLSDAELKRLAASCPVQVVDVGGDI